MSDKLERDKKVLFYQKIAFGVLCCFWVYIFVVAIITGIDVGDCQ